MAPARASPVSAWRSSKDTEMFRGSQAGYVGYGRAMPTIDATRLEATSARIFAAMGAPDGDAAWIATLLARANLRGHDSHGVIRIPQYIAVRGVAGPGMVLDFATSVVAEGKLKVKKNRKEHAPPGWFVDAKGRPSTDPEAFYGDPPGALLPAGEHKGYGLSLAVEIL